MKKIIFFVTAIFPILGSCSENEQSKLKKFFENYSGKQSAIEGRSFNYYLSQGKLNLSEPRIVCAMWLLSKENGNYYMDVRVLGEINGEPNIVFQDGKNEIYKTSLKDISSWKIGDIRKDYCYTFEAELPVVVANKLESEELKMYLEVSSKRKLFDFSAYETTNGEIFLVNKNAYAKGLMNHQFQKVEEK